LAVETRAFEISERSSSPFVFLLGGHDHDISWQESTGLSVLCKNLSNCRTLTVILLSKSALAARCLPTFWPWKSPSWEEIFEFGSRSRRRNNDALPPGAHTFEQIVERITDEWCNLAFPGLRVDFVEALDHLTGGKVEVTIDTPKTFFEIRDNRDAVAGQFKPPVAWPKLFPL
jgi:hypothetical protein